MDWRDEGVLLSVRRHGESAAIIDVFTREHGRHSGVVRGGAGRRMAPILQPGAQLSLEWRARLEEHLGAYRVEPLRSRAGQLLGDGDALAAFNAVAAMLTAWLPERDPHGALYAATIALVDALGREPDWPEAYVAWEIALLTDLGYPLDLSRCAATGAEDDLIYVSPRTGRAVSAAGGADWADRLLPLPGFLAGAPTAPGDVAAGLAMTGHFLNTWVAPAHGAATAPAARGRLVDRLSRPRDAA